MWWIQILEQQESFKAKTKEKVEAKFEAFNIQPSQLDRIWAHQGNKENLTSDFPHY